jgi:signal transduction histidine kinase
MATTPQTFANHKRRHAPFHFFVIPVMLINIIWAIVIFVKGPNWNAGWWIIVSLALVVLAFLVRWNSLKVQDRVIQLEERLRYQQVLSAASLQQANALKPGQIIALRFAGDDELEELVAAVLAGKLARPSDIKQEIKSWRADMFRV